MVERSKIQRPLSPNIFDYATGELSQDAFICWFIKLADCEGHELQTASKEFIALLCRIGGEDKNVLSSDVGALTKLSQQKEEKIDVFFIAVIKGKAVCFIIEDKVDSQPHSGQLKKYVNHVKKTYLNPIVKVYFKTGYLFDDEISKCNSEKEPEFKYGILDYKQLYNFLAQIETQDVIFNLYRDYIQRNFFEKFTNGLAALEQGEIKSLKYDFIQYEFLKKLSLVCKEIIGDKRFVKIGTSFGTSWAEYDFIFNKDFFAIGKNEYLTYRVEPRKSREKDKGKRKLTYSLSLRHYAQLTDTQHKKRKLERLNKYKAIFEEISRRIGNLSFSKPLNDHTGSNSSEISLLFFDDNKNSIQNVLNFLPAIHKEFVAKIQNVFDVHE